MVFGVVNDLPLAQAEEELPRYEGEVHWAPCKKKTKKQIYKQKVQKGREIVSLRG